MGVGGMILIWLVYAVTYGFVLGLQLTMGLLSHSLPGGCTDLRR